jgi:hypothetical protein
MLKRLALAAAMLFAEETLAQETPQPLDTSPADSIVAGMTFEPHASPLVETMLSLINKKPSISLRLSEGLWNPDSIDVENDGIPALVSGFSLNMISDSLNSERAVNPEPHEKYEGLRERYGLVFDKGRGLWLVKPEIGKIGKSLYEIAAGCSSPSAAILAEMRHVEDLTSWDPDRVRNGEIQLGALVDNVLWDTYFERLEESAEIEYDGFTETAEGAAWVRRTMNDQITGGCVSVIGRDYGTITDISKSRFLTVFPDSAGGSKFGFSSGVNPQKLSAVEERWKAIISSFPNGQEVVFAFAMLGSLYDVVHGDRRMAIDFYTAAIGEMHSIYQGPGQDPRGLPIYRQIRRRINELEGLKNIQ